MKISRGGKVVLKDIDLDIDAGDKLGIFGQNGAGKTTLIKAILGEIPSRGDLWVAPGAEIGYFAQGHDTLDCHLSPLEQINKALGGNDRARARFLLARFLLAEKEVERPISTLSGGERARVALAMLIAERRNLLVLDEPTNYLDIMAKHAVESALAEYAGTILVITHDRYLLDSVCNKIAEVRDYGIRVFNGSYSEYKGARTGRNAVEEAEVYKVISGFTEWVSKKKFLVGDKVLIARSEKENFQWALDNGKLKKMPGKERKIIKK